MTAIASGASRPSRRGMARHSAASSRSPTFCPSSGPLHAGTFGPNDLDNTFGPQLRYIKAPSKEQGPNLAPSEGMQFFSHVAIDGATEVMTVTLKDVEDRALWSTRIEPRVD